MNTKLVPRSTKFSAKVALFVALFTLAGCEYFSHWEKAYRYRMQLIDKYPVCEDELHKFSVSLGNDPADQISGLILWEAAEEYKACK